MTLYPCKVQTMLSEAQDRALQQLAFRTQTTKTVLIRQAILAMIDYEVDAYADFVARKMKQAGF